MIYASRNITVYFIIHRILHRGNCRLGRLSGRDWYINRSVADGFCESLEARATKGRAISRGAGASCGKSMRYVSLLESRHHQPSLATLKGLYDGMDIKISDVVLAIEAELE